LEFEAVVWGPRYGEIHELPPYPSDTVGGATAINDKGQVVGASGTCGPPGFFSEYDHALLWQNGRAINLGSLGGQHDNVAAAINDNGQVVGGSDLPGDTTTHAFLWQDGVMTDLGTPPDDTPTGSGQLTTGATAPKVILPATVCAQLRARLGVGLLRGRAR
jgi:probable HAF family extracellular repeat protein